MMTRKHFKEVAEIIKDNTMRDTQPILNKETLINDLSLMFKIDNSLFNKSKFVDACNKRVGGNDNV